MLADRHDPHETDRSLRVPEVDLFAGTLSRLGRTLHIPTPANDRALRLLSDVECGGMTPL